MDPKRSYISHNPPLWKKRAFVKKLLEGKSKTQAAKEIGYGNTPGSQSVAGTSISKLPDVQRMLAEKADRINMSADRILKEIDDGLKAKKYGAHDIYLDKLMAVNGVETNSSRFKDGQGIGNINVIFAKVMSTIQERGITE